jgi:hypothetical protein
LAYLALSLTSALLNGAAYGTDLVLFRVLTKSAGNRHRPAAPFVNEVAVAALAAAIGEAGPLQFCNQISNLDWQTALIPFPVRISDDTPGGD